MDRTRWRVENTLLFFCFFLSFFLSPHLSLSLSLRLSWQLKCDFYTRRQRIFSSSRNFFFFFFFLFFLFSLFFFHLDFAVNIWFVHSCSFPRITGLRLSLSLSRDVDSLWRHVKTGFFFQISSGKSVWEALIPKRQKGPMANNSYQQAKACSQKR